MLPRPHFLRNVRRASFLAPGCMQPLSVSKLALKAIDNLLSEAGQVLLDKSVKSSMRLCPAIMCTRVR